MPAPKARNAASFSCTRTLQPRWRKAMAAANPQSPPGYFCMHVRIDAPWLARSAQRQQY